MNELHVKVHPGPVPHYSVWVEGSRRHTYAFESREAALAAARRGEWAVGD